MMNYLPYSAPVFRSLLVMLLAFAGYISTAQTIPADRLTDWSKAGLQNTIPLYTTMVDIMSHGGDNTGATPNDAALQTAIAALNGSAGIVYFPSGTYLFNQSVSMRDSLVLKGNGSGNTKLVFDLGHVAAHMFNFHGSYSGNTWDVAKPADKDSSHMIVLNAAGISAGDWLQLYGDDVALTTSAWAYGTVGQIVQVKAVYNDSVIIAQKLRRSYDAAFATKVKDITPITGAGIECMYIQRYDSTIQQSNNIDFDKAVNCWVVGVESDSTNFCHIAMSNSAHLLARGNYLHHAHAYGGSGKGYGVAIQYTSGDCLIENNKFEHLRHSMLVQAGANGNVFAYNYSTDPYWDEPPFPANSAGDIVCHGNYPYLNLFEGNVIQNIVIDNSHGINGPFNTIFRNRADGFGIFMNNTPATDSMNFVANDVTNTTTGLYTLQGTGHFELGNMIKGTLTPVGTSIINHTSLFRYSPPGYWLYSILWPGIGIPYSGSNSKPIPTTLGKVPDCRINPWFIDIHVAELPYNTTGIAAYPNPANSITTFRYDTQGTSGSLDISICDMTGRQVAVLPLLTAKGAMHWDAATVPAGMYLYQLRSGNNTLKTGKLVVSE